MADYDTVFKNTITAERVIEMLSYRNDDEVEKCLSQMLHNGFKVHKKALAQMAQVVVLPREMIPGHLSIDCDLITHAKALINDDLYECEVLAYCARNGSQIRRWAQRRVSALRERELCDIGVAAE